MQDLSNLVVYNDGELELKVSVDSETIWLTQLQMSQLFDTSTDNVGLHLKNIYLEKELDENSTTEFFSVVRKEGNRLVKRELKHYNLDVIICVGYRVSSLRATKFRQWATSVLKNYIQNGYVINGEKITNDRFVSLENDVNILKSQMNKINSKIKENISLKTFKSSHDRFLIIDKKEIYHLGASLKDLGKKWFAFSKMSLDFLNLDDILHKLEV
ncbi:virulence RhuM family protein [Aliarcobacter skirrowii]|uniref:virulence RhuM family protein n=1 Tax=Aliarcobacter skirrowii TaxID=28200 RepID=UPI0029ACEBAF|nr:RhuM family protein [Aliarcobacter skirrowii]MDX4027626.1 RhuM family protein [Aliarcobacter skirrowii]